MTKEGDIPQVYMPSIIITIMTTRKEKQIEGRFSHLIMIKFSKPQFKNRSKSKGNACEMSFEYFTARKIRS